MNQYLKIILTALLLAGNANWSVAADEIPLELKKRSVSAEIKKEVPATAKKERTQLSTKTEKKKPISDLDRQLQEELSETKKAKEPEGKQRLKQLIKRMEQVEQEISKKKTGEKTQQLQQSVVDDLSWLIKQIEQQKKKGGLSSKMQQASTDPKKTPSKKDGSKDSGSKPNEGGKNKKDKSNDSDNNLRTASKTSSKVIEKRMLEKDVWGHLPPTLRKKLLNIYSEKYLPQYDEVVRKYFESLAEEGRKNP